MWAVNHTTVVVLFLLIGVSQGRVLFETITVTQTGQDITFDSKVDRKPSKPPALLDGLQVRGAEIAPEFQPDVFNYTARLSNGVSDVHIIAQVSLEKDSQKYKVKTESSIVDSRLQFRGNESTIVVQVHVSADKHQPVIYYLEIGHALQERNKLWRICRSILYTVGIVLATVVVVVFLYSMYLAVSAGGVTGYFSRSQQEYGSIPSAS